MVRKSATYQENTIANRVGKQDEEGAGKDGEEGESTVPMPVPAPPMRLNEMLRHGIIGTCVSVVRAMLAWYGCYPYLVTYRGTT